MHDVRPSPIAGTWYPGDPKTLESSIDSQLERVPPQTVPGEALGLVVPHAGHRFSGLVAAHAFHLLKGRSVKLVVVVSPFHRPHHAALLTTRHHAYGTPLGTIDVDLDAIERLSETLTAKHQIRLERIAFDTEHALEIELPFLQRTLQPGFLLVPLMVVDQSRHTARALGESIAELVRGRQCILIASSDLSHFYPQTVANQLDLEMLSRLEAFDPDGILSAEEQGVGFACGRAAMAAVVWAAKNLDADGVQILKYATSGDVTGDFQSVVGYGSAVIYRQAVEGDKNA